MQLYSLKKKLGITMRVFRALDRGGFVILGSALDGYPELNLRIQNSKGMHTSVDLEKPCCRIRPRRHPGESGGTPVTQRLASLVRRSSTRRGHYHNNPSGITQCKVCPSYHPN